MAPRAKKAFTTHADMMWDGCPPAEFRPRVEEIIGRSLLDVEWAGFCRVLFSYSLSLSHEHVAAPLALQQETAIKLEAAAESLISAISVADTMEMGSIVSSRLSEKWDDLRDRGAEFDRDAAAMASDIAYLLALCGHPAAEQQAWQTISDWQARGMIVRPDMPSDFLLYLGEFRDAVRLFVSPSKDGGEPFAFEGDAWVHFVGRLTEWMTAAGIPAGASKSGMFGQGNGRITYLAKAVNELVPKVMRRPPVADDSLADSIIKAQKRYQQLRPPRHTGDS